MPKRNSITRYEGWEGQGEDSFVTLKRPTVDQMQVAQDILVGDPNDPNFKLDKAAFEVAMNLLRDSIYEWNWCDEDGQPLPQVKSDPGIVGRLTDQELTYLMSIFKAGAENIKNLKTNS